MQNRADRVIPLLRERYKNDMIEPPSLLRVEIVIQTIRSLFIIDEGDNMDRSCSNLGIHLNLLIRVVSILCNKKPLPLTVLSRLGRKEKFKMFEDQIRQENYDTREFFCHCSPFV